MISFSSLHVAELTRFSSPYKPSDHMEAPEVIRLAGCEHPTIEETKAFELAESQKEELEKIRVEMERWKKERVAELEG